MSFVNCSQNIGLWALKSQYMDELIFSNDLNLTRLAFIEPNMVLF